MDITQLIEEQVKATKDFPTFGDEGAWPEDSRELFTLLSNSEQFRGKATIGPSLFMLHLMLGERNPNATMAEKAIQAKKSEELALRLAAGLFIAGYRTGKAEAEVAKLETIASA